MAEARVLFVCTGNQCRSPMAEALLRSRLDGMCDVEVSSAGTAGDGTPPPRHAVEVMAERGLDIAGRPSRPLDAADLAAADLVVAMARQHLVDVATLHPPAWDRAFTFTDLSNRAAAAGGRGRAETLAQWASRMSAGRSRASVLAAGSSGDIPDPIGGTRHDFEQTRDLLEELTGRLAPCLCAGLVPAPHLAEAGAPAPRERGPGRRRWWRRG